MSFRLYRTFSFLTRPHRPLASSHFKFSNENNNNNINNPLNSTHRSNPSLDPSSNTFHDSAQTHISDANNAAGTTTSPTGTSPSTLPTSRGSSFLDELYKLKLISNMRPTNSPTQVHQLNAIFEEFNLQRKKPSLSPNSGSSLSTFQALKSATTRLLLITQASLQLQNLTPTIDTSKDNAIHNISVSEQSMILETYLHNTLLLLLSNAELLNREIVSPIYYFIHSLLASTSSTTSTSSTATISSRDNLANNQQTTMIQNLLAARQPHSQLFNLLVKSMKILRISTVLSTKLIQEELNSTFSRASLSEIATTVLPITEYIQSMKPTRSAQSTRNNNTLNTSFYNKFDLQQLRSSINTNSTTIGHATTFSPQSFDMSAALRLVSCLSQLDIHLSQEIASDLAESILSSCNNQKYDSRLTESEMSVLLNAIASLHHPLSRKIQRCMGSLLFDYETKIERMLTNNVGFFDAQRVPTILATLSINSLSKYRPSHRKNQVATFTCPALLGIACKNAHTYRPSEIAQIILASRSLNYLNLSANDSPSPTNSNEAPFAAVESLYITYFKSLLQSPQHSNTTTTTTTTIPRAASSLPNNSEQRPSQQQQKISRKHNIKMQRIRNTSEEFASIRLQDFLRIFIGMRSSTAVTQSSQTQTQPSSSASSSIMKQPGSAERKKINEIHRELLMVLFARYFQQKPNNNNNNKESTTNITTGNKPQAIPTPPPLSFIEQSETTDQGFASFDSSESIYISADTLNENTETTTARIQVLYEISYNHSEIFDSQMFEDNVSHWIVELSSSGQLGRLSNHDLIALGFIMRRFARLFVFHFDFWMRFAAEIAQSERAISTSPVEAQRIRQVLTSMYDFYLKCLSHPPTQFRNDLSRTAHLNLVTNTLAHTLDYAPLTHTNQILNENSLL